MQEKTRDLGRPQGSAALWRIPPLPAEHAVIERLAKILSSSPDVLYFYVKSRAGLRQDFGESCIEAAYRSIGETLELVARAAKPDTEDHGTSAATQRHRIASPTCRRINEIHACRDAHPTCASPARATLTSPTLGRLASTTARAHTCR
jgi:hypothetical protein